MLSSSLIAFIRPWIVSRAPVSWGTLHVDKRPSCLRHKHCNPVPVCRVPSRWSQSRPQTSGDYSRREFSNCFPCGNQSNFLLPFLRGAKFSCLAGSTGDLATRVFSPAPCQRRQREFIYFCRSGLDSVNGRSTALLFRCPSISPWLFVSVGLHILSFLTLVRDLRTLNTPATQTLSTIDLHPWFCARNFSCSRRQLGQRRRHP